MEETRPMQSNILQSITDKINNSSNQIGELVEKLFILNGVLLGTEPPLGTNNTEDKHIVGKLAELEDALDSQAGRLAQLQALIDQLADNLG